MGETSIQYSLTVPAEIVEVVDFCLGSCGNKAMEVKTHRTVHECLDTANVCVVQLTLPVE